MITMAPDIDENIREVYSFLLFATRIDMSRQRTQMGIDGALLFEELAQLVAQQYFGERAGTFLLGTASRGHGFMEKISTLITEMGEGRRFENRNEMSPSRYKDDGVDVVVWKPFADGKQGKLIGFGQCKTGTHWKEHLERFQPESFCKRWFRDQPGVPPVRLFFISESVLRINWFDLVTRGGILFDRCRIMDYFPFENPIPFMPQIKEWNKAVKENILQTELF